MVNPVSKLFGRGSKGTTGSKPDAPAANRTASSGAAAVTSGSSRSAGTAPPLENMTSSGYSSDVGNKKMSITSSLVPHHEGQSEVHALYDTSDGWELGRGGCGTITVVTKRSTGEKFAMKRVALDGLEDTSLSELRQEIEIQRSLDHPNIVKVFESFEDHKNQEILIIMEMCTGGSLVSRMRDHRHGYGERAAATLVEKMLSAVTYCHRHSVMTPSSSSKFRMI